MTCRTRRSCWGIAAWLGAAACGPTQPSPPDPWSAGVRVADVTDRSRPRSLASSSSCLAVAADGHALVLWTQRGPESDELWAQVFASDGQAGRRQPIQEGERLPRVSEMLCGLDDAGRGYASWIEYSEDQNRLLARRLGPQGWDSAPVLIEVRPFPLAAGVSGRMRHDLAVDAGGRALIAWTGDAGIRSAVATEGVWADAGLVEPRPFSNQTEVTVELRGPHGIAAYARDFTSSSGGRGMAGYARFLGPEGWGPAQLLGTAQGVGVRKPTLDDQGRTTIVTFQVFFPVPLLCIDRYQGSGWTETPCRAYTTGLGGPTGAASGEVVLLTLEGENATPTVARWLPGADDPVIETAGEGGRYTAEPGTALSMDGTTHAAWITNSRPWVSRVRRGGHWVSEPVPAARTVLPSPPPCSPTLFNGTVELRLGADALGNEVVTWIEGECGTGTLWLQRRTNDSR